MSLEVLFVVGKGRSGSTLVGDTLGSFEGVFHAGELWRLWSHGLSGRHRCSCDQPIVDCPVWSRVLDRMRDDPDAAWSVADPPAMVALQQRFLTFSGALIPSRGGRQATSRYVATMRSVYRGIAATTGADVVVDSSKWPLDPVIAAPPADLAPSVVHLVKDPRDVAASWRREKAFPDTGEPMPRFGPVHSSLSWMARTWAAERAVRRVGDRGATIRFEDFLVDPSSTLTRIDGLLDHSIDPSAVVPDAGHVVLGPGHTVMGNPGRFTTGEVALAKPGPPPRDPVVSALTFPWRLRFGYR